MIVGYKFKEDANLVKKGIIKMLACAENRSKPEAIDDSMVVKRSNFEEIQLIDQNTEDFNVQPLSQYVQNEYSQLVDSDLMTFDNGVVTSETESEDDTSETEKENIRQILKVKLTLGSFKNYLLWSAKNTVKRELVKTGFVQEPV